MIQLTQLKATLDGAGEQYHILPLQGDAALCITRRGGRILGLFPTPETENLLWTNTHVLADPKTLTAFANDGDWNLGGERVWIAPEIQYNIHDRSNFWETHHLPQAIDPGSYTLEVNGDTVTLEQEMMLEAYNIGTGTKQLRVKRVIAPIPDPLRRFSVSIPDDVTYCGYRQASTLTELNDRPLYSESWNLVQVNPGGSLYILTTGRIDIAEYFGDVPDDAKKVQNGHINIRITGDRQYKVGYKAAGILGRLAYCNTLSSGRAYLLIRQFDNDPSATYSEEPPDMPGSNGYSVHVYNDDGEFGGFGEIECNGRAIGGDTGRTSSTDVCRMWVYVGSPQSLQVIADALLGIAL